MPHPRSFSPRRRAHARPSTPAALLLLLLASACALLLSGAAAAPAASAAAPEPPQTGLVDLTESGVSPFGGVYRPGSISADGRYVAFSTASPEISPLDTNGSYGDSFGGLDVFVRDRRTGQIALVSVNADKTGSGDGPSYAPALSPDGRYVAFISHARNLAGPDPGGPGFSNVYLRDLLTNQTVLVSRNPSGLRGDGASGALGEVPNLFVSEGGRYVSFVSGADDLVPGDANNQQDAFVRDVQQGVTHLVSVKQSGAGSGDRGTSYAVMTPNGRYVAFRSQATDLTPKVTAPGNEFYLRDLQSGTTKLVSANRTDGAGGNGAMDNRSQGDLDVSDDGRYVAFVSSANDLAANDNNGIDSDLSQDVFVRDTVAGTTQLVSVNKDGASGQGPSGGISMSPDGRFVAFVSSADDIVAGDSNGVQDVFLRDVQAGTTALVTARTSGAAAGIPNFACQFGTGPYIFFNAWQRPSVSADGRYVAFVSSAADLSATPDTNCTSPQTAFQGGYDLFVRDMQAGTNRLVTAERTGASAAMGSAAYPHITPDGAHVLFNSWAGDLVVNDTNQAADLFVNVNLPAAGSARFAQHAFVAPESAGQAVVTVTRAPGAAGGATVSYTTLGGTASAGSEFTPASGTLTFAPGEESKQFTIPVFDDADDEDDETVILRLTDAAGGVVGEPSFAAVVIADDDPSPRLTVSDGRVGEGDSGGPEVTFLVTLSGPSPRTVTAHFATEPGTAQPNSDYETFQGTYTFPPGAIRGLLKVRVRPDTAAEGDETFSVVFSNPVNVEIEDGVGVGTIADDDLPGSTKVSLAENTYTVAESAGRLDVQVTRTGDLSAPSSVSYWSFDLTTSPRTDYTAPAGVLTFAPGESAKTLTVFITDDALREGDNGEMFFLILYGPEGCTVGANYAATVYITSEDTADGPSPARQQGDTSFFVRQHYRDFLGRDPDAAGLAFWTGEIESCGSNQQCREVKRVNVSAAFFLSIEFQETGYLAYRTYKAAYGRLGGRPVPIQLFWFIHSAQQIGRGVVVNQGDWRGQLEQNKREFFDRLTRDEFFNLVYPAGLSAAEFVAALDTNAGGVLTEGERAELTAALSAGTKTRAGVLRAVAENAELTRREFNKAFVLMQYFGYLRRNPDEFPDANFAGFDFWLSKLEEFGGNYIEAEMVKAFINSDEYLKRFGQ